MKVTCPDTGSWAVSSLITRLPVSVSTMVHTALAYPTKVRGYDHLVERKQDEYVIVHEQKVGKVTAKGLAV